jgi:hypothetical protein
VIVDYFLILVDSSWINETVNDWGQDSKNEWRLIQFFWSCNRGCAVAWLMNTCCDCSMILSLIIHYRIIIEGCVNSVQVVHVFWGTWVWWFRLCLMNTCCECSMILSLIIHYRIIIEGCVIVLRLYMYSEEPDLDDSDCVWWKRAESINEIFY